MFNIGFKDVVVVVAAGVAMAWWLSRKAKQAKHSCEGTESAGWNHERHAAFALRAKWRDDERFSKFHLN